jgi:hypothetical protein
MLACKTEIGNARTILVEKPEWRRTFERRKRRRENNTETDIKETGCDDVHGNHLAQVCVNWLAFANTVVNLWVPKTVGNFLTR